MAATAAEGIGPEGPPTAALAQSAAASSRSCLARSWPR
ncbi:hypothetical protein [Lysobacter enzymogenes]